VERHRPDIEFLALADRFFSPDEARVLGEATGSRRQDLFFTLWSCKEAFVKARGLGLSFPLNRCRVSVEQDTPRLLEDPEDPAEHHRWSLSMLPVRSGYSSAIVVEGSGLPITTFDLRY